jgi:hypothetical protein
LQNPEIIKQAADSVKAETRLPKGFLWQPHSVAQGFTGLALLWGYMDTCYPDEGWDRVARQHIELAVDAFEKLPRPNLGLYSGLSGLAFTASYLSRDGARYQKLLSGIERVLIPRSVELALSVRTRRGSGGVFDFDVISGLAGIARYLLLRQQHEPALAALQHVLQSLVWLTEQENGLPRWYTPAQFLRDGSSLKLYPNGNLNCGLAHGCPGILAALSISELAGQNVAGMSEAIDRLADWLAAHTITDEWGINWPTAVPLGSDSLPMVIGDGDSRPEAAVYRSSRCAWCYGSTGVARAIWLAGKAVGNSEYQRLGIGAMEAVYRRPIPARRIDSPTFCHGVAGLLQVTLRFASDTGSPGFFDAAASLWDQLASHYQPESLVGFLNIEPGGMRVEQPGLLDGAAGVLISLLAASTECAPSWDALFLLC